MDIELIEPVPVLRFTESLLSIEEQAYAEDKQRAKAKEAIAWMKGRNLWILAQGSKKPDWGWAEPLIKGKQNE